MANEPGVPGLPIDPRVDSPNREGLTGTAPQSVYTPARDPEEVTVAPDGKPRELQPRWRKDFPIDVPEDQYVARRDFAKFMVLTSGAFVAGQGWIAAQDLVRKNRAKPARMKVASLRDLPVGAAHVFAYPTEHHKCLLLRLGPDEIVAFSQSCTHLACAVVPKLDQGVLHCPCHEGYFDARTGKNIAGPPPRPLPRIVIAVEGDDVFALGVDERTV